MEKQIFKREDMLTAPQIRRELNNMVSIRQVYNLLERGDIAPAFRFAGKRGLCAPKEAVERYKQRCRIDVGA